MTTKNAAMYAELEQASESARVLAAATLSGQIPFLGVFGARDDLARTFSDGASRIAGHVYLDAVQAGMVRGEVVTDSDGFIATQFLKGRELNRSVSEYVRTARHCNRMAMHARRMGDGPSLNTYRYARALSMQSARDARRAASEEVR